MRFAFSLRENIDEKTSSCKQKNARRPADPRPCAGCHLTEMGNQGIMRKRSAFSNSDIGRTQGHRPYDWLGIFGCDSSIRLSRWVGLTTDRLGVLDSLSRLPFLCF